MPLWYVCYFYSCFIRLFCYFNIFGCLCYSFANVAQEVDLGEGKKAVVIFVPTPQLTAFQKLIREKGLIEELEKKLSGKHVSIIGERRIVRKESRKKGSRALNQLRPRSRTLTSVHASILEDLVFPTEIVGKRLRYKSDGSRLLKVHLQQDNKGVSDRIDAFKKVYLSLTMKDIAFEFPSTL